MKKIIVSKDRCPLEAIAEMREQTKNAWIFLNKDTIEWLKENAITIIEWNGYTFNIGGRIVRVRNFSTKWYILDEVTIGEGIEEFEALSETPENFFLVEMAN